MPTPLSITSPSTFVLLHHVQATSEHWDLCLDAGEALLTWQLAENPASHLADGRQHTICARRLQDHRRAYLDYEGPVSNNRGHVKRVDRGTYTVLVPQPHQLTVRLDGSVLIGTFRIIAGGDSDAECTVIGPLDDTAAGRS